MLFREIKSRRLTGVCKSRPFSSQSIHKKKIKEDPRFEFSVLKSDFEDLNHNTLNRISPHNLMSRSFQVTRTKKKIKNFALELSLQSDSNVFDYFEERDRIFKIHKKTRKKFWGKKKISDRGNDQYLEFRKRFLKKHGENSFPLDFQKFLNFKKINGNEFLINADESQMQFLSKAMSNLHKDDNNEKRKLKDLPLMSSVFENSKLYSRRLKIQKAFSDKKSNNRKYRKKKNEKSGKKNLKKISKISGENEEGDDEKLVKRMVNRYGIGINGGGRYFESMMRPKSSLIRNGKKMGGGRIRLNHHGYMEFGQGKMRLSYSDDSKEGEEEGKEEEESNDSENSDSFEAKIKSVYAEKEQKSPILVGRVKKGSGCGSVKKKRRPKFFVKRQKKKALRAREKRMQKRRRIHGYSQKQREKNIGLSRSSIGARKRKASIPENIKIIKPEPSVDEKITGSSNYRTKYTKKSTNGSRLKELNNTLETLRFNRIRAMNEKKRENEDVMKSWRRSGTYKSVSDVEFLF